MLKEGIEYRVKINFKVSICHMRSPLTFHLLCKCVGILLLSLLISVVVAAVLLFPAWV